MISKDEVLSHFLKDDKPFAVNLYEKYKLAYEKDIPVFGNDFYPPNVWSYFQSNMSSKEFLVQTFGLFDDAERRMISFNNKYNEEAEISCIKISNKSKFRKVNHRDYLGSILSLGIKRNKIGDLIVDNDKCYVAVSIEIRDYIINNLEMVANCPCKVEIVDDISSLPKVEFLEEVLNGNIILVAHNAIFDMRFLKNTLERLGYSGHIRYLDTLKISYMFPTINHHQSTIAEYLGIRNEEEHRAYTDAITCGKILNKVLEISGDYL